MGAIKLVFGKQPEQDTQMVTLSIVCGVWHGYHPPLLRLAAVFL